MIAHLFHIIFYQPLYNGLVYLLDHLGGSAALGLIALTLIVRLILFPLSYRAAKTQLLMRKIEPELAALRERFGSDRQKLGEETMALYRRENVSPFSTILLLLVQLPVLIALYLMFARGGLPNIAPNQLYHFVALPSAVSMIVFGSLSLASKSIILALIAGASQFVQAYIVTPKTPAAAKDAKPSFQNDFARSMNLQMKYVFPIFITVFAYSTSAAVALYWTIGNLFTIGQELYLRAVMPGRKN